MAIVSFTNYKRSQTKGLMINVIKYCIQDKKTMENGINFVSGVNCTAKSVVDDFMNTKLMYHKSDGKMFFHLVQAFEKGEDIKPETAHEMAIKLAEYFKDYEVLVSTHFDRDYTHSHLIINSVNFENGKKFHFLEKDLIPLRKFNDELCKEYGCKICEPKPEELRLKGMKSSEYHSALKGESWKFNLINTIDDCMRFSKSKEQFKRLMQLEGYQVKWEENRKSITYTCPNGMKCRDNKLHQERYLKIKMEREFELRQQRIEQFERITQAEQLQMDGEEYRLYIRQSALVKCIDCGYSLSFSKRKGNSDFQCSLYSVKGKEYCSSHYIKYYQLYDIVLSDIRRRAEFASRINDQMLEQLKNQASGLLNKQLVVSEQEYSKINRRIEELDVIITKIYEDSVLGKMTETRANTMIANFEKEQKELKIKKSEIQDMVVLQRKKQSEMEVFTKILAGYKDIQELNATMLNELIFDIKLGVKEKVNGVKKQTVQINYRHSCFVPMFEESEFADFDKQLYECIKNNFDDEFTEDNNEII